MKFVRFRVDDGICYGILTDGVIEVISAPPYEEFRSTGQTCRLENVTLLTPVVPSKILAIALNYPSHLENMPASLENRPAPQRPEPFLKAPSSLADPDGPVILPPGAGRVDEEGELVVVIGRSCRNVSAKESLDYVLGFTCGADISAREWQKGDIQWWRAKSSDTFSPLGPAIDTEVDGMDALLVTRVNGREVQRARTSEMLFKIPQLISAISRCITLEPGDVIYTGTPGRTVALHPGDLLEVEIEGIGILTNPIHGGS